MSLKTTLFLALFLAQAAFAYSGSFATMPALPGGPATNTITNFDIDTRTNNPQTINTNLDYVYQVIIETSTPEKSNLLITENPSSGQQAPGSFSFTVPQRIQDALVSATIYFWGPNQETLTIEHVHQGTTTEYLTATKASPETTDGQGRILWMITTTSFSEFIPQGTPSREPDNTPFIIYSASILLASASALALFRTK